ncbi:periplasmic-type flagellar collar protein FlcA, partial [Salinispira pacifica]
MPKIEDIRRFNDMLVLVGKEPQVLAERGESVEIPAPEPGAAPGDGTPAEGAAPDIDSLISDIASEAPETSEAEAFPWEELGTGGGGETEEGAEESPFDFENVPLDDLDIGEGHIEGLKPAEPDLGDEEPEGAAEPEFDLETFDFDTADYSEETASEEPPSEEGALAEGLEPFEEAEPESGEPEEPAAADEEAENLFDVGDEAFDFDFGGEEPAEPEAEGGAPAEDQGVVFEAPEPSPEAGGGDEFELPDIGEDIFEQEPETAFEGEAPPGEFDTAEAGEFEAPEELGADFDESAFELPGAEGEEGAEPFDFEAEEAEAPEARPAAAEEEPAEADEFSFDLEEDDLSGLEFEEPSAPAAEEPAAEAEFGGEEEFAVPDHEEASFTPPDESELARQAAALESAEEEGVDEDLDVDEFNLGDFGAEFGVLERVGAAEAESEEDLNPAISIGPAAERGGVAPPGEISLSDKEFDALKRTLQTLPLNLKISVEEIIGEGKGSHEQLDRLIQMLVRPTPIQDIASLAGRILGKRIVIPRGYEKRSGVAFEAERRSFAYQFRENILPILRVFVLATGVLALLVFLGYRYIYR